jgi:hypothetical protein
VAVDRGPVVTDVVNGDIVVVTWALFVGVAVEFDVAGVLLVQPATTMVLDKTSSMKARNLILEQPIILIYLLIYHSTFPIDILRQNPIISRNGNATVI